LPPPAHSDVTHPESQTMGVQRSVTHSDIPSMEDPTLGADLARLLFDKGVWFATVVQALVDEHGLSEEDATLAAQAAAAERILAAAPTRPPM
jgi:hypothetical protein